MRKQGAEKGERNQGLSREEGTSQLVHCESNQTTIWLFVMLLCYIDFVLGRNSKVINGYCSKKQFNTNICVLSSWVIKMA
jgi:hypothetical protein